MDIQLVPIVLIVITIGLLFDAVVITKQKTLKHISFLGKYWRTALPGLSFKVPLLSKVDYEISTAVSEQTVELRLKTQDQVTFGLNLNVIYQISDNPESAYRASYDLDDYEDQIRSFTTDSSIPIANGIPLEDVFDKKESITDKAKEALEAFFSEYGIEIKRVLSDEPALPPEVEDSANEVISAKRLNDAAKYKAEAIRTEKVGEATADGESVKIRMDEIGKARKAYATETAAAVEILAEKGINPEAAMGFLARVGDQDALVTASRNSNSTILSIPSGASSSKADTIGMTTALNGQQAAAS